MLEARKKDKEIYKSTWGENIPFVQQGLEELMSRITDGEFWTDYVWDSGMDIFENWNEKYGNKIYDMVNLRCGEKCPHYVKPTKDKIRASCEYCDMPTEEDPFTCSACADIPINMMNILMFTGLKPLLAFAQDNKIDYELVYEIIDSYGQYYEEGKLERLLTDIQMAERWQKLKDKITTKKLKIGTINKENKKYDIILKDNYFQTIGYKGLFHFQNEAKNVFCSEVINNIYGSDIIEWNVDLLENLEELYDLR